MFHLLSTLFGGAFTLAAAYGLGGILLRRLAAPPEIRLAIGAAAESAVVFVLLLCHAAIWPVLLAVGACGIAAIRWHRPATQETSSAPSRPIAYAAWVIFAGYGMFYLVNALAPEVQPDGITYHLGLAYEYARLGGFPDRVRFYDLIPQGMEMLFTMAFLFGRHAAAKLVEFGVSAAAAPLIFRVGRRLGMSETGSLMVAVFYWTAPLVGLAGSSTYNDAAQVFFTLAAFYLLLTWRETGDARYLLPAGVLAGFCYAIKFPGIFAVAAAVLFVAVSGRSRRWRDAALLAAGIALAAGPWMVRNALLTGNPIAPLGNSFFPNAYFHLRSDRELAEGMRSLHGIAPAQVPWQLALGDGLSGTYGPLLLLLPLGLLAARRREGRVCLIAAAILAVPWFSNTGARFLMPAVVLAAFALGMVLPAKAAWAAIAVQALVCLPPLLNAWQPAYAFRLHELPWKAALGIETEEHYLQHHTNEYNVARMVEHDTPPDAGIFSLMPVATAYAARDVSVAWQSAEGDRLVDTLRLAAKYKEDPLSDWTASWPLASLRALRFRLPQGYPAEWDIAEVRLLSGEDRIFNSPSWSLRAWPNLWEAPLALDNRRSTVWRTWQPARAGMFFEVDLDHPQNLSGAMLTGHSAAYGVPLDVYGQRGTDRTWRLLTDRATSAVRPLENLRLEATAVVRRAGYRYLLVPLGNTGHGPLGWQLLAEAPEWGLEIAGNAGPNILFKLR
ncbi:MAG: glycosyltransferase family 39 protein [Candidatus Sulfopaludibacter sp.]|nr:glycosyltransferase family 39 protein [Candidatus Sulfopaludibacter sp.]